MRLDLDDDEYRVRVEDWLLTHSNDGTRSLLKALDKEEKKPNANNKTVWNRLDELEYELNEAEDRLREAGCALSSANDNADNIRRALNELRLALEEDE